MHCWKNTWAHKTVWGLCLLVVLLLARGAQAQATTEMTQYQVERAEERVLVSCNIAFELPSAVEEALLKGIPMYFVVDAIVYRERWYWYDRKVTQAQRYFKLTYQPLTRRWRVNLTAGSGRDGNQGLALNPSFDTLAQALATIKRISRWHIIDTTDLDMDAAYKVELRFRLDVSKLPLPFQIGTLGQADWELAGSVAASLPMPNSK